MSETNYKRFAIPAALVIGGVTVGSFVSPIGLASANTADDGEAESDDGETEATESDDGETGHRHGRRGFRLAAKAEVLEDVLGLSATEIRDALSDGNSLAAVADAQGVSVDELTAALVAAITERIDEAVADGRIDADRAEERKAGLEERVAEMVERVPSEDFGERRGHRHGRRGALRGGFDAAGEALGLTNEEIRAGFADGKTLADLAEEQGVSTEDLAAALVADATERLDEAVAEGKIDEDRAAEAKESLEDMVDRAIEAEPFALGRGIGRAEGRRGHHRFHHRHGGDAAEEGEVVESSLTDA